MVELHFEKFEGLVAKVPDFGGETRGLILSLTWLKITPSLVKACLIGANITFAIVMHREL